MAIILLQRFTDSGLAIRKGCVQMGVEADRDGSEYVVAAEDLSFTPEPGDQLIAFEADTGQSETYSVETVEPDDVGDPTEYTLTVG